MASIPLLVMYISSNIAKLRSLGVTPTTISMPPDIHHQICQLMREGEDVNELLGLRIVVDPVCPPGTVYVYNDEYMQSSGQQTIARIDLG